MKNFSGLLSLVLFILSCHPVAFPEQGGRRMADIGDALVSDIAETGEGFIWMSTMGDGLFLFDGTSFIQYVPSSGLSSKFQTALWVDSSENLWVGTQQGVDRYDKGADRFVHYDIEAPNHYVIGFAEDPDGALYTHTRASLFRLDPEKGVFSRVMDLSQARGFNTRVWFDGVGCLHVSEDGWEEVYDRTLHRVDRFETTGQENVPDGVRLCFQDREGNEWRALENGGYCVIPRLSYGDSPYDGFFAACSDKKITSFAHGNGFVWAVLDGKQFMSFGKEGIQTISLDKLTGHKEIHTFRVQYVAPGRILLTGGYLAFQCSYGPDGLPRLESIFECADDFPDFRAVMTPNGAVWAGNIGTAIYHAHASSPGQRHVFLEKTGEVDPSLHVNTSMAGVLRDGRIILCFSDLGPVVINPVDGSFRAVPLPGLDGQVYIYGFLEDRDGSVWFYSSDKGVFVWHPSDDAVRQISSFAGKDVVDMAQDRSGRIFVLSESELFAYNPKEDVRELLWRDPSAHYHDNQLLTMSDGSVVLKSGKGFYHPSSLKASGKGSLDLPLHLVLSSDGQVILNGTVDELTDGGKRWRLPNQSRDLKLYLAVIGNGQGNLYDYQLKVEAASGGWIHSIGDTELPLYGLRFGNSRILLKVSDYSTGAESPEFSFLIRVPVPWYIYAGMIVVPLLILALAALSFLNRRRKKDQEEHQADIDFFANMSHEFRAPLTLIVGAASSLKSGNILSIEQDRMLQVIRRNSDRMLKLVSQMLDFNKLDHGMLQLHVRMQDVSAIVGGVASLFQVGASRKNIDFEVNGCDKPVLAWVDADKVEKMLYNLCSNALKFTPASGRVTLSLEVWKGDWIRIRVLDTGIGIPKDQLENVFRRFVQLDSAHKSGGTGVGLYYTKSLAELHHGRIWAENRLDGPGSVFTVELPIAEDAYSPKEREPDQDVRVSADPVQHQSEFFVKDEETQIRKTKPTAVVIDDDYELVYYIRSLLSNEYNVLFRFDAMSGYVLIEKEQPDIVICDVMMVDVDGFELCRLVKENLMICHIPVILLTGRSTVEDQVKGLGVGADAYVVKPFNPEYLTALVASTIRNRQRIQHLVRESTHVESVPSLELSARDKAFMDKLFAQMEASLSEEGLDIDTVADSLGIGRTKFYSKVKALTGQTPNGFFNVYKLNRAAELIKEGKYKISAIANLVGFNSASHFSTVFKKQFGVLPSQYANDQ